MAEFALSGWLVSEWTQSLVSLVADCYFQDFSLLFFFLIFFSASPFCLIFPASACGRVLLSLLLS